MKCLAFILVFLANACCGLRAADFTVLVYNVENLFDLDGVAEYSDYTQEPVGDYGVQPLLTKLENIRRTLAAFNDGTGPEIILFQEFELDRTPFGNPDAEAYLRRTKGTPLGTLFQEDPTTFNLPAELLLLKHLDDHGMSGYHVAQADPFRTENHTAQKNVVFTRYPVSFVRQRTLYRARDLLVVGINVEGRELIVLNNHWKSGASNPETEPVRVQNALVVKAELSAILQENPQADVIVAGDFNCYYNQKEVFGGRLSLAAMNDILGADGFETRMPGQAGGHLYNLWNELPLEERGSEVYRGYWGTLMQIILTQGLYDGQGIQYIDNSFNRLLLPGVNAGTTWQRPRSWTNFGGGAGFSDHLPVYARFRTVPPGREGAPLELRNPADQPNPSGRPKVRFDAFDEALAEDASVLAGLDDAQLSKRFGDLFRVRTRLSAERPARVRIGDRELEIYSYDRSVRDALYAAGQGDLVELFAELGQYRGKPQFVIQDASWLRQP